MSSSQTPPLANMPGGIRANSVPTLPTLPTILRRSTTSGPQGRRQSAFEALGIRKRSDIDIVLEGSDDFVHSYTTHDEIKGDVIVKFNTDTVIDDLVVTFEGTAHTYVEKIATTAPTTGRTTGRHTFLKLIQPINTEILPENRLGKAGVTYSVPFQFVVPDRLLPYVCSHKIENEQIKNRHVQLPPSLGDPMLVGDGKAILDDLAPEMARISYSIRAQVVKRSPTGRQINIGDKMRGVRIIPAGEEPPPMNIEDDNENFCMRKEKNIRKGMFKIGKKTGRMTAEAIQPAGFRLPPPNKQTQEPVSTAATINLRFDPQNADDQPPQLSSIVSKLRAYTFFGAAPFRMLPSPKDMDNWSTLHGMYPDNVELSTRPLTGVSWTRQEAGTTSSSPPTSPITRRPSTFSTFSTLSIPEPSAAYSGSHFYTTTLIIPLALPKHKAFVPSFHSCIISRTYALELNLYYTAAGSGPNTSVHLKVPMQISAIEAHPFTSDAEAALQREIEMQFFQSEANQWSGPPIPEYRFQDAVPGYSEVRGTRHMSIAEETMVERPIERPVEMEPPEYHSGLGRMPARSSQAPRTRSEFNFMWQRRPSLSFGRRAGAVLAL